MSTTIAMGYASGPPFEMWPEALFGQGWNTLKPACFPKAMDVLRLWDDGTGLNALAPAPGSFNWAAMDAKVAAAEAAGKLLIYTFGNTPAWAAQSMPTASVGASDATSNRPPVLSLIQPVVEAIATRYKGKIMAYESWNEYNAIGFYCGTMAELLAWQQMLFSTIRAIDPAALITTPTPCWNTTTADVEITQLLSMGFQNYAEIVTFHGYFTPGASGAAIAPTLAKINAAMQEGGCGYPLWDTEFGFSGSANGQSLFTPAQQREWVFDAFAARLAAGVRLMAWYQWDNFTHSPGITDVTGATLTPAGQAMVDLYTALHVNLSA